MPTPSQLDASGDAVRQVIRAYHGSPYDFDRFDASKIGTGEGAQAYGHGLYFAGKEEVADQYRRQLAGEPLPMDLAIDGSPVFRRDWQHLPPLHKDGTNYLMSRLRNYSDDYASEALSEIQKDLPGLLDNAKAAPPVGVDGDQWYRERYMRERRIRELQGAMELLRDRKVTVLPSERPGKAYEVEIGHPEDALIDWDATLDEQQHLLPAAERAIGRIQDPRARYDAMGIIEEPAGNKGRDLYGILKAYAPESGRVGDSARFASRALLEQGVPGIRYLDGGSRRAGQGTRNYVMFPGTEDQIRILRKYAVPGAIGAGAASAGSSAQDQ
jgi:hypothetical protein